MASRMLRFSWSIVLFFFFLLFIRTLGMSISCPTIASPVSGFLGRSASLAHASAAFGLGNQGMGLGSWLPYALFLYWETAWLPCIKS